MILKFSQSKVSEFAYGLKFFLKILYFFTQKKDHLELKRTIKLPLKIIFFNLKLYFNYCLSK